MGRDNVLGPAAFHIGDEWVNQKIIRISGKPGYSGLSFLGLENFKIIEEQSLIVPRYMFWFEMNGLANPSSSKEQSRKDYSMLQARAFVIEIL